ncbi:nitroreductase/quinone reductase family protein [Streptomyces sp. NBC_01216]|uniref:nitroreductase/quinone reductase family protein n=1 Tax=unclassified Streptomyces TaxID=2593676 RepID=UPI002E0FDCF3|nr:nitroreductase family deazaflavin-dependent oxidoreductase [Streptomyces sp. NBC_01216]
MSPVRLSRPTARRPGAPSVWKLRLARFPLTLFRAGLGPLFGGRLLRLIHTGRGGGQSREAVLGVVLHDRERGIWIIVPDLGPGTPWYRSLRHAPQATIQFGRRYHVVTAHFPTSEDGGRLMVEYARRHPRAAMALCRFMGLPGGEGDGGYRTAGERIPFVRLEATDLHP